MLENTTLIRDRIEAGEVKGPRILTVGEPFWGKGGTPIYVRDFLQANHISIPDVESSAQAAERVRQQIHEGGTHGPRPHAYTLARRKQKRVKRGFEKGMNTVVLPQLRAYSEAGGQILFGTDVGYIEQFDTSEEFLWMSRAGMSFRQILAALTTNPAERFGYTNRTGRIVKGADGDLVILSADPEQDIAAFSKVRYTIRGGKVIYSEKA